MDVSKKLDEIEKFNKIRGFYFTPSSEALGVSRPDTLGVSFDESSIKDFLKEKGKLLAELEGMAATNQANIDPKDYLLPFEQVLAHESFHVYQTLTCSVLADYSMAMRRQALIESRVMFSLIDEGHVFKETEKILDREFDQVMDEYRDMIAEDSYQASMAINQKSPVEPLTVREIIEAGAVAFQLVSQQDYFGEKIPIEDSLYTRAWDRFVERQCVNTKDIKEIANARLLFLFTCDIYLKYASIDFKSTDDFEKMLTLASRVLPKIDAYFEEFSNSKLRDSLFVSSLSHVERDESVVAQILEYCGTLNSEKQMRLYINTRLYADIFKQIALAGAVLKSRPTNNKNRAINLALKKLFPFWDSDFLIACVLTDYEQISKFMMLWTHIKSINFIDDTKNEQTSLEDENIVLEFMRNFNMLLRDFNSTIYCCSKHKLVKGIHRVAKCVEPDSINQMCITGFGKPLGEIIDYG